MEIISVAITAIVSISFLFLLAKLMGNRTISQMNIFDYINGISIGSIAAELATSDVKEMEKPFTAMAIYGLAVIVINLICNKSMVFRRFVEGRSVVLVKNGKFLDRNFGRARIDLNEFLMQCRLNGFFNINDIQSAVLESNGKISVLPFSSARPANPSDFSMQPQADSVYINIVLDGKILQKNLKGAGFNETWLENKLKEQKISDVKDVFVAVCNQDGEFYVFEKQNEQDKKDIFDM